jgi:hypothetical protein
MNLLSAFRRNVLRPLWEFSARGVLWQVHAGSDLFLVGEDRNLEKKEVSFFCLDARDGRVVWRDLVLEERWWMGVEALHAAWVVFHRFASPDLPGHRGVTVVHLGSGEVLWSRQDVRFRSCAGGTLRGTLEALDGEQVLELNLQDGRPAAGGEGLPPGAGRVPTMLSPRHLFAQMVEPALLEFLAREQEPSPVFPIQVVEAGAHRAMIAHWRNPSHRDEAPDLAAHLLVVRRADGGVVYREMVNAHVGAPTVQSMFALENVLIYSRQRSSLSALPL